MEIGFKIEDGKNLNTKLHDLLCKLPEDQLYYREHNLRHPIGIYNVSVRKVISSFNDFILGIENKSDNQSLSELHRAVVDAYLSFFDDMCSVMKCFYSISAAPKNIFQDKWLSNVAPENIKSLKSNLWRYRDKYARINNNIKHNHARYCHVTIKCIFGIKGYYIESVNSEGAIAPDTEIHPKFNNQYTATSYNYDIRNIIFYWLAACEIFFMEFESIIKSKDIQLDSSIIVNEELDEILLNILKKLSHKNIIYFEDEYSKDLCDYIVEGKSIIIKCPVSEKAKNKMLKPSSYKIEVTMSGDGITNSFAVPYL